jgi:hypothetical protein
MFFVLFGLYFIIFASYYELLHWFKFILRFFHKIPFILVLTLFGGKIFCLEFGVFRSFGTPKKGKVKWHASKFLRCIQQAEVSHRGSNMLKICPCGVA